MMEKEDNDMHKKNTSHTEPQNLDIMSVFRFDANCERHASRFETSDLGK